MIQDIQPHHYDLTYQLYEIEDHDRLVLVDDKRVCLIDEQIPIYEAVKDRIKGEIRYLFSMDEVRYYACLDVQKSFDYTPLRSLFPVLDNQTAFILSTACHLRNWYSSNLYCGCCGHRLKPYDKERALYCEECGRIIYPVIAPAVIVALRNGENLLMTRYAGRPYNGKALIAGFCEIGETPEETCIREVMEEVGLRIKNIHYYASQPWGIDSNLLLGYVADVDGDTKVHVDHNELSEALGVRRDEIEYKAEHKSLTATMM